MQDFNGEIDFSKLKVAKKQPSFIGANGANFAQNRANLKANFNPNAQNIGANLGTKGANFTLRMRLELYLVTANQGKIKRCMIFS